MLYCLRYRNLFPWLFVCWCFSLLQYPGWSQMEDGSIRVSEVTEDSLGTYTCVPYNSLGTMGQSPPAPLVLKVKNETCRFYLSCLFLIYLYIISSICIIITWCLALDRTHPNFWWFLEGSTGRRLVESWSSPVRQKETHSPTLHGER